jgi:hypothetical protein
MRRAIWGGLTVLVLAVLAVLGFLATHERVPEREIVFPAAEVRADRFLAATRLLRRLDIRVQRQRGFERPLPDPAGRVYLLAAPRGYLSQDAVAALRQAVEQGGHLVVESEALDKADPVFEAFGIARKALPKREDDTEFDDWSTFTNRLDPLPFNSPGLVEADWVAGEPLRVGMRGGEDLSIEGAVEWQMIGDLGEVRALHFRLGAGRVTAVNDIRFATNWGLGRNDEAEFLVQLLQLGGPPKALVILEPELPGLLAWLIEHAWRALLGLAVLVVLSLWIALPRRGRLLGDPELARRRLGEHLAASGRLVHAGGGDAALASALRTEARQRLQRHHPELAALAPSEQVRFSVERLKLSRRHAQRLFDPASQGEELMTLARAARALLLALEPRRPSTNPLYPSGSETR